MRPPMTGINKELQTIKGDVLAAIGETADNRLLESVLTAMQADE